MSTTSDKRRRFIKAGLSAPLLSTLALRHAGAATDTYSGLSVPDDIRSILVRLYGEQANHIMPDDSIAIKAPDIAENGAVVPVTVSGQKDLVSSVAIFSEKNPNPLAATATFVEGTDLQFSTRIKTGRTSNIYAIAKTDEGLIGTTKLVKVTVGCGGG